MTHQATATSPSDSGSGSTSMGTGTGTSASASATSLARGKACLRCRKRKMRCDGAHPACAQCVRAHKAEACAYDDGRGKTRTQALRERIVRLEAELERLREGRGDSASAGGKEESVFLVDPHAPPPSSASSKGTFGELDFVDFGTDAFGEMDSTSGMEIERPTTSLSDPSSASASESAFSAEPLSFNSTDSYSGAGGVHRTRTIRPRDHLHTGGLREPRGRPRPSSGVFGYSANHPLVQQAQGYGSPYQFQFQQGQGHSRTSSTGSPSPSPSTVGSAAAGGGGMGASPYSSFTDPLSLDLSPFHSPDPAMFASSARTFTSTYPAYSHDVDQEFGTGMGMGMSAETESTLVQLVLAHRDQVGLALHPGRLLASLSQSSNPRHHPVLRDALALVGARLARRACGSPVVGETVERVLLRRAQAGVNEAMRVAALPLPSRSSPSFEQNQSQTHQEGSASPPGQGPTQGQGSEGYASPALDALQVHVLLARYLFAEGRKGEARVHAASAADLVLQLGLHQLRAPTSNSNSPPESGYECESTTANGGISSTSESVTGTLRLPLPGDAIAFGERVALFWAVFVLDRMVGAALGLPPCVADDDCVETRVDTPWPEEVEEYEHIPVESIQGSATLRSFFLHQGLQLAGVSSGGFAPLALLAKAAALYAACGRTSANWGLLSPASPPPVLFVASSSSPSPAPGQGAEDPTTAFARLETCLARLASALLPAHQLGAGLPEGERRRQVVLHTLVHASVVRLHVRLARAGVGASLEKCVRAARAGASIVRTHVGEKDYAVLDPVFGSCWTALAEVFSLEPVQAGAATPGSPASAWVPHDLSTLLAASARLQGASSTQVFSGMESDSVLGA